jgi:hypothetical protein
MPILGRARPAFRSCRHAVALQNIDLFEISRQGACRRQTADATTHHHCTPTEKAAHSATLQRFLSGQITLRRLRFDFRRAEKRYIGNTGSFRAIRQA